MVEKLQSGWNGYLRKYARMRRWQKIVMAMAALVVFVTTYALILPAITLESQTYCGYETGNSEQTMVLTCTVSEEGHVHQESCYELQAVSEGGKPVHEHTEQCFLKPDSVAESDGTWEQVNYHAMLNGVQGEDDAVIAGDQPGGTEREWNDPAADDAGISEDGIREENTDCSRPAAAQMNGSPDENSYSAARMMSGTSTPRLLADPQDPYDMSPYITTVNIQHRKTDHDLWEDIKNGTVQTGDQLRFDISYELPGKTLDPEHRTIHYQLPDQFEIIKADSGTVLDGSNAEVGTYVIETDGKVSITFSDNYVTQNANGSKINGHIAFESSVDGIKRKQDGSITIPFKEEINLTVKDPKGDIKVEKESYDVDTVDGTMKYRIRVISTTGTFDLVVLTDTFNSKIERTDDAIEIADKSGNTVTPVSQSAGSNGFTLTLPQMTQNSEYVITYNAKLSAGGMSDLSKGRTVEGTNHAEVSSRDSEDLTITSEDSVTDKFTKKLIEKYGEFNGDGTIQWTITVNGIGDKYARIDLSGWKVSDEVDGAPLGSGTQVVITPDPLTGTGSVTTNLPYTFPQGSKVDKYTITYVTADSVKGNKGILTAPDSRPWNGTSVDTGVVTPGGVDLVKTAEGQTVLGTDKNGNVLLKQKWNVTLTASTVVKANRTESTNGVPGSDARVFPNGGYWDILDQLGDSKKMYFTREQMADNTARIVRALEDAGYEGRYYIFAQDEFKNVDRLITRSAGSDPYFENASSWNRMAAPEADDLYNEIRVVLDSDWGPAQISFDLESTLNAGSSHTSVQAKNIVMSRSKDLELKSTVSQDYMPALLKYDSSYTNKSSGLKPTEHTMSDVIAKEGLRWGIDISLPAEVDYTESVVITDTLPEGLYIKYDTSGKTDMDFIGHDNVFGKSKSGEIYYQAANKSGNHGLKTTANNGQGTITDGTYTLSYRLNKTREHEEENCIDEIIITIPPDLANQIKGSDITIKMKASPDNYSFASKAFANTVTADYNGSQLDQSQHTQTVTVPSIQKGVVSDAKSVEPHADKTIPYVITINPGGADLAAGSDTLTVSDVLTYTMPDGKTVNVSLDSIRIFKAAENCTASEFTALSDKLKSTSSGDTYAVKETALNNALTGSTKILEEITDSCPYTITETMENGKVSYSYQVNIPDEEKILILYSYRFTGSGQLTDLTNKASVCGQGSSSSSDEKKISITVQDSNAGAVLVGINVYKVDSKNYAVHLNGAYFRMEKWNGREWTEVQLYKTDGTYDNGEDKGYFNTGKLDDNTAYRLIETQAPPGYEMKTATVYEFYIRNTSAQAPAECIPEDFTGKQLNNGDDFYIANEAANAYTLPDTGGTGTIPYLLCGIVLMTAAGFGLRRRFSRD